MVGEDQERVERRLGVASRQELGPEGPAGGGGGEAAASVLDECEAVAEGRGRRLAARCSRSASHRAIVR